jgi:hypothetical protein
MLASAESIRLDQGILEEILYFGRPEDGELDLGGWI